MPNGQGHGATPTHTWRFFRAGGFDQVRLDRGADLAALDQLDQKLWVALACPTLGLEFDARTLGLIDTDKDGRIRAPDIIAAAKWACAMVKDPDTLVRPSPALPLSAINDATPEGRQMLASAKQILAMLGKPAADAITVDDTTDTTRIFAQTRFNGDGVVPADAADSDAVKAVINEVIACMGAETDRSGKPGVSQLKVDQFFAEAQAYSDWWAGAERDAANVLVMGEATAAAAGALNTVRGKVEDFFARCRLAAFDSRAQAALNRQESEYLVIAAKDLAITLAEVAGFPLARIEAGRPLSLRNGLNPAWVGAMAAFREQVVKPVLGDKDALTEEDWAAITARFAAFEAWSRSKAGAAVEKLGLKRVRELLAGNAKQAVADLIARDKALEPESNVIAAVDKLARYYRDLHKLLCNFVSFRDFYGRQDRAVFQAGRLYLDQRSCDLCVRVEDMGKHGAMAPFSQSYLAYCECTRKATGEKMTIAAAFTAGDSDNLMVGRNGIFYDRQGRDWDATIVKVVDNPISIRQAFWAPYKRLVRWVQEQVAKRAAAADAAAQARLEGAATGTAAAAQAVKAPPAPGRLDVGVIAAFSVAAGFLSMAAAAFLNWLAGTPAWMIPVYLLAILLLISGPSMAIAWLKLRQRSLGPILDANGWAVNAKAKISIPFGRSLTATAVLPPGSHRDLFDPYAEKKTGRIAFAVIVVVLLAGWALWNFGVVENAAPNVFPKSEWVKARLAAPTTQPATQPGK